MNGQKPGARIDGLNNSKKYLKLGLEAIPTGNWDEGKITRPLKLTIGKPQAVEEVLLSRVIPEIPQIRSRISALLEEIKDKSVAKALVFLDQYPRQDEEYAVVEMNNLERPEVAAAIGVLLGYKDCCIKYYVETRYLGAQMHKDEKRDYEQNVLNPYTRCFACVSINQ